MSKTLAMIVLLLAPSVEPMLERDVEHKIKVSQIYSQVGNIERQKEENLSDKAYQVTMIILTMLLTWMGIYFIYFIVKKFGW